MTVHLEREGALARLVLDRPPVNVLDIAALEELSGALTAASAMTGVRVLTLSGCGKAFCAGVDVADHTGERVGRMLDAFHDVVRHIMTFEVPVVALVHGAALGGGWELALACDIVLARDDLKAGLPEIRLGVFPPVAAALLARLAGRQRAMELVLSGRTFGAAEAQALGLVSHVYPAGDFGAASAAYVGELAGLSGSALRLAKLAVGAGSALPFGAALERAEEIYRLELMETPDAREGLAAFMEKRPPVWQEA